MWMVHDKKDSDQLRVEGAKYASDKETCEWKQKKNMRAKGRKSHRQDTNIPPDSKLRRRSL